MTDGRDCVLVVGWAIGCHRERGRCSRAVSAPHRLHPGGSGFRRRHRIETFREKAAQKAGEADRVATQLALNQTFCAPGQLNGGCATARAPMTRGRGIAEDRHGVRVHIGPNPPTFWGYAGLTDRGQKRLIASGSVCVSGCTFSSSDRGSVSINHRRKRPESASPDEVLQGQMSASSTVTCAVARA